MDNSRQAPPSRLLSVGLAFLALGGWGSLWLRLVFRPRGSGHMDWTLFRRWCMVCIAMGLLGVLGRIVVAIARKNPPRIVLTWADLVEGLALWVFTYVLFLGMTTKDFTDPLPVATYAALPIWVCWFWRRPVTGEEPSWLKAKLRRLGVLFTNIALLLVSSLAVSAGLYLCFGGLGQDDLFIMVVVPVLIIVAVVAGVLGLVAGGVSSRLGPRKV